MIAWTISAAGFQSFSTQRPDISGLKIRMSTPQPTSVPLITPTQSSSKPSSFKSTPKAANVFTNDGSFLERFQRTKKEEDEKKKSEDALMRKRDFDNRFKKRGKRPPPDSSDDSTALAENLVKKHRLDKPLTDYEEQVKSYGRSLKDNGIGVRPLVK